MDSLQRGFERVWEQIAFWGPIVLLGLILVVVGWIVAKIVQAAVSAIARKAGLDKPFAQMAQDAELPSVPEKALPSTVLGIAAYWVVMLMVITGFLSAMHLDAVAEPLTQLLNKVSTWLPNLLGALILAIVGWLVATVVRTLVVRGLQRLSLDERLAKIGVQTEEEAAQSRFATILGNLAYALLLLLFIPTALEALGLRFVAESAQTIVDQLADAVPNILAAISVMAVAALIAFIVRPPIVRLLEATGVDAWGREVGLTPSEDGKGVTISSAVGHAVFWAILLFAFPAALDQLGLEPIVTPLRNAWEMVVMALPRLAAAVGIGVGAYLLARVVGPVVQRVLQSLGFDNILGRIGLTKIHEAAVRGGGEKWLPSKIASTAVVFVLYLILAQEALAALGMDYMAGEVRKIVEYLPNLLVGVGIFGLGLYLGSVVAGIVRASTSALPSINSELIASAANIAVVVFATAMALSQLQIGGAVVQNTVLLIVAGACLAGAIAVGLGSRTIVEEFLRERLDAVRAPDESEA
ncbi:MAG: hypothetical protein D6724_09225 [Armatimonadetes bacterium]|nr:MAG: hypothetical protein D6724_09225 [Armatimonadota bacterium]